MSWGPKRVGAVESADVHPVVGLAAEVVGLGVEIDPILFAGDLAGGEIVELSTPAGQMRLGVWVTVALSQGLGHIIIAMLDDEIHQQLAIELCRVHTFERLGIAPLPMLDQITEELGAPAGATFKKGEIELREAAGHATEENRLGDGMTGGGEMADVIVDKVCRRQAQSLAATAAVEGRRNAELERFAETGSSS